MNGNILRYPWHFSVNVILYHQRNITIATISNVQYIFHCMITTKAIIPQISWGRERYLAITVLVELSPGHSSADTVVNVGLSHIKPTEHIQSSLFAIFIQKFSMRNLPHLIFINLFHRSLPFYEIQNSTLNDF